jgi:hypothetical protein
MCPGKKIKYITLGTAVSVLGIIRKKHGNKREKSAYWCPDCFAYHLTSDAQAQRNIMGGDIHKRAFLYAGRL